MKISVAMTTYNGAKYLIEQLDSLRLQVLPPDEVIICDDRSTDNTLEIITRYVQDYNLSNWIVYDNENNLGFIDNFYKSISLTTGDLVFMCDQDDIWLPDKIKKMSEFMEKHQNIKVLTTGHQLIDSNGIQFEKKCSLNSSKNTNELHYISSEEIVTGNNAPGCTCCFTKEIKGIYLKDDNVHRLPHDYLINILGCIEKSSFYYDHIYTNYRIHSSNTIGIGKSDRKKTDLYYKQYKLQYLFDVMNTYLHDSSDSLSMSLNYIQRKIQFYKNRTFLNFINEVCYSFKNPILNRKLVQNGLILEMLIDLYHLIYYKLSKIRTKFKSK